MMIEDYGVDGHHEGNHNDFHQFRNANEQMNDDDYNYYDDDDDDGHHDWNDSHDNDAVVVLEKDFAENDEHWSVSLTINNERYKIYKSEDREMSLSSRESRIMCIEWWNKAKTKWLEKSFHWINWLANYIEQYTYGYYRLDFLQQNYTWKQKDL